MGTDDTPTVMVVDDHPIWRDAVARDLADDGFNVVATADGVASARRRAAVVKPDVVVMDMRLPDGGGVHAGSGRAGAGGVPAHRARPGLELGTKPDRAGDRDPSSRREGPDRQAD